MRSPSAPSASRAAYSPQTLTEVDMRHLHFDTTSVSVWGEYAAREADGAEGLRITFGYSKDLRPDLKQFLVQMLCVHRNIPVLGAARTATPRTRRSTTLS